MTTAVQTTLIEALVADAVAAPSSHNTQPWLFEAGDDTVDLLADRTRALPVNDPNDRELTISCGAALFNLQVSALHRERSPDVTLLPDPTDPDRLARVGLSAVGLSASRPQPGDADLFWAIAKRRTTRSTFDERPLPAGLLAELIEAASGHGALLHEVPRAERDALADLIAEGDHIQFADRRWRRELASWMHPRRRGDGLVVPEVVGLATKAVVSVFDLGTSTGGKDHELAESAPLVLVLATDDDDPAAWLRAGQTLQHVLLIAARHDVYAGYLNQPCQVDALRSRLQQLLPDRRYPQVVIRLGRLTDPPRATPRRPIADVITPVQEPRTLHEPPMRRSGG